MLSLPRIRVWLAILALFWSVSESFALTGNNLVIPIYKVGQGDAIATVKIDSCVRGHQRRGYFRIGLLPEVRILGIDIQLRDVSELADALKLLPARLPEIKGNAVRISGFRVSVSGETKPLLEGETVTWTENALIVSNARRPALSDELIPQLKIQFSAPQK